MRANPIPLPPRSQLRQAPSDNASTMSPQKADWSRYAQSGGNSRADTGPKTLPNVLPRRGRPRPPAEEDIYECPDWLRTTALWTDFDSDVMITACRKNFLTTIYFQLIIRIQLILANYSCLFGSKECSNFQNVLSINSGYQFPQPRHKIPYFHHWLVPLASHPACRKCAHVWAIFAESALPNVWAFSFNQSSRNFRQSRPWLKFFSWQSEGGTLEDQKSWWNHNSFFC